MPMWSSLENVKWAGRCRLWSQAPQQFGHKHAHEWPAAVPPTSLWTPAAESLTFCGSLHHSCTVSWYFLQVLDAVLGDAAVFLAADGPSWSSCTTGSFCGRRIEPHPTLRSRRCLANCLLFPPVVWFATMTRRRVISSKCDWTGKCCDTNSPLFFWAVHPFFYYIIEKQKHV